MAIMPLPESIASKLPGHVNIGKMLTSRRGMAIEAGVFGGALGLGFMRRSSARNGLRGRSSGGGIYR